MLGVSFFLLHVLFAVVDPCFRTVPGDGATTIMPPSTSTVPSTEMEETTPAMDFSTLISTSSTSTSSSSTSTATPSCQRCSAFASEQLTNYVGYTLTAGGIEIDAAGCNTMTLTCTGNNPYLDFYGPNDEYLGDITNTGDPNIATLTCNSSEMWEVTTDDDGVVTPTSVECY